MKTSAIIRIVCGVIVASLLSWILIFAILPGNSNWFPGFSFSFGNSYSNADAYSIGGGSVAMEQVDKIEINWTSGQVQVVPYAGNEIIFEEQSGKSLEEAEQMRYRINEGKLTIQFAKSQFFRVFNFSRMHKTLTVKIPKELAEFELNTVSAKSDIDGLQAKEGDFNTTSGNIELRNAVFGELDGDSVSGNLYLTNATAQYAAFSTVSGDIKTDNFVCEEIKTDTVSGEATLVGSFVKVKNNATSGNIYIHSSICPQKIDADGISSDVKIIIPDNDGFLCSLDSVSGKVDSDFDAKIRDKTIVYGNSSAQFDINTTSGDVFVKKDG